MNGEATHTEIFSGLWQDDRSGLPKYQRLANALTEAIRRGVWRAGDRLPAEEELTAMTPYSLGTVQRALRDLTNQGLVIRQHGLGSFVAENSRRLQDPWHCRFVGDDGVSILPIYTKAIGRRRVTEAGPWTQYLGVDASLLMQVERIININFEFNIFSRFYASRLVLKTLWDMPIDQLDGVNFKELIATQCRLPITQISHHVRIDTLDPQACEILNLEPNLRGLFMQAIARAGSNTCVYYQEFFIPPTRRSLQFLEHTPANQRQS